MASKSESRIHRSPSEELRFTVDASFKLCVAMAPILGLVMGSTLSRMTANVPAPKPSYQDAGQGDSSQASRRRDPQRRSYFDYRERQAWRFVAGYAGTIACGLVACAGGLGYYVWKRQFGSAGFLLLTLPFYLLVSGFVFVVHQFRHG